MTAQRFEQLCASLCELAGESPAGFPASFERFTEFQLRMRETEVMLVHDGDAAPNAVAVFVEFGAAPADQAVEAWRMLMQANFLMRGEHAPCFCCSPTDDTAFLRAVMPLDRLTPQFLYLWISRLLDVAHQWKRDHFLAATGQPREAAHELTRAADFA